MLGILNFVTAHGSGANPDCFKAFLQQLAFQVKNPRFLLSQSFYVSFESTKIQMFLCVYIYSLNNKLFQRSNTFQRSREIPQINCKILRGSLENPWSRYCLIKMAGKKLERTRPS
jgi:hypothetical protein